MIINHRYTRTIRTIKALITTPIAIAIMGALLSGVMGCQKNIARVDDTLLPGAPAGHMVVVRQARIDRDTARDNRAKAKRDVQISNDQLDLARSEVNVALSQLSDAKLSLDMARKNGTTNQADIANEQYKHRAARLKTARMLLPVREREIEHATLVEKLAAENILLADAKVELAKANAVKASGRVEANKVSIKDFEKQVALHERAVAAAQTDVNQATQNVQQAKQNYEAQKAGSNR